MRLLHITSDWELTLEEFDPRHDEIPPYAVLSYTPEETDVAYNDLKSLVHEQNINALEGTGWEKIRFCAEQMEHGGPNYFWLETCCVDYAGSWEVMGAIDDALNRLQNARICYVLLSEVYSSLLDDGGNFSFKQCAWFTHCWTLPDLVAPSSVEFFTRDRIRLGDRESLQDIIQEDTGMPSTIPITTNLHLLKTSLPSKPSVFFNMRRYRKKNCERDKIYCQVGIFGCTRLTNFGGDQEQSLKQPENETKYKERCRKISDWLSAPDPSTNHLEALKHRKQPDLGLWFLKSTYYKEWRNSVDSSRLWFKAIPESQKTRLSSTVIENLQQHCRADASMVTVYFYFDINDDTKRDAMLMLRSLLHQFVENLATTPDFVEEFCTVNQTELETPLQSHSALLVMLRHVKSCFSKTYIVLDSLDECMKQQEILLIALQEMMDWQSDNVHIFVTSQRYGKLMQSVRCNFNLGEIITTQNLLLDIQRLAQYDIAVKQELQTSLHDVIQGKLHDVDSQFTMLSESFARLLQKADDRYDSLLCSKSEESARRLQKVLKWLAFAMEPLTLHEMEEVISVDPKLRLDIDTRAFEFRSIIASLEDLKILCLEQDDPPDWRKRSYLLMHNLFPEYLFSNRIKQGPAHDYSLEEEQCHKTIAKDCLMCLMQVQQPLSDDIVKASPLVAYAARFWTTHFQRVGDESKDLIQLAANIFSRNNPSFLTWIRLWDPDSSSNEPHLERSLKSIATPLYYAALLGLESITTLLLEQGADVNAWGGRYGSALQAAAFGAHPHIVTILLNAGADVNAQGGHFGSALQAAAFGGYIRIVEILLDMGADANAQGGHYGSALQAAASGGRLDTVLILLHKRAGIEAQGGQFESAIHAARVSGFDAVADLILQFIKLTAGPNVVPSDSGYASQRQADSLKSPSIPDSRIQCNFLIENQQTHQAPSSSDEETCPDDIRSIKSDNESIGSKISTTRSTAELFAVKHLAMFFAQLEDLRSLHEMVLQKIERKRFISNYRRILKFYYCRLLNEAASETEKVVTRVLRSRRNRESIAEKIADQLEFDEENEQPSLEITMIQPYEKQYLEDWMRRMQDTDDESSGVAQKPLPDDYQLEDSDSDSGFDIESEVEVEDEFANIDGAETFLQQGLAFRSLVLDIRLLLLPHHLRRIVETTPKSSLQLIGNSEIGRLNNAKAFLESYTGYRWDWWPLAPRIPDLGIGEHHLQWKLGKRILYMKITPEQFENLCGVLDLADDHPPRCHCCVTKPLIKWSTAVRNIFREVSKILENNKQKSAMSGSSSSKAAMAYTPAANNTSGTSSSKATPTASGANASGVALGSNNNNGAGNSIQAQRHAPVVLAPIAPKAPTRIIFGVQGMRRSLEIEQIEICDQMNDQSFFSELKRRHKKHRWSLQRLLSPFRFEYCNFVKFEKLNVNRVFSFGEGLPDPNRFANDYDYNPKPPQGKIPLIEPALFAACLETCKDDCKWALLGPWLHDCFQLAPLCDHITCIPKKKSEFPVQCKKIIRDTAWGIEAEYTLSFWILCVYHLVPLLSSFGFWIYWLRRSPGDWQNASVPTITTIALFAFVWVPFGFVFNSHRPVKYR